MLERLLPTASVTHLHQIQSFLLIFSDAPKIIGMHETAGGLPEIKTIAMEMNSPEFMREAIRLSVENVEQQKGGPFGAVVVKDGKIIARGVNLVTASNDPTAHAEVVAIRNACKTLNTYQLDGCEIYTSCEPCPMCLGAIYWARPAKLFYANRKEDAASINFDDQFIYEELAKPIEERTLFTRQMMREEAMEAFTRWATNEGKIEY